MLLSLIANLIKAISAYLELKNKSLSEAVLITNKEIASNLNLPPVKLHCSLLAEEAIKSAIDNYKSKQLN
jgi:nitrogen fixation NifU-like protein